MFEGFDIGDCQNFNSISFVNYFTLYVVFLQFSFHKNKVIYRFMWANSVVYLKNIVPEVLPKVTKML